MNKSAQYLDYVSDVNLVDVRDKAPDDLVPHGTTYIVSEVSQWGDIVASKNDLVTYNKYISGYVHAGTLAYGNLFLVGGYNDPPVDGIFEQYKNKIIRYRGGDITSPDSWVEMYPDLRDNSITQCSNLKSLYAFLEFTYNGDTKTWHTDSISQQSDDIGFVANLTTKVGTSSKIIELTDVNVSNPTQSQILTYDEDSGNWVNREIPSDVTSVVPSTSSIPFGKIVTANGDELVLASAADNHVLGMVTGEGAAGTSIQSVGVIRGLSGLVAGETYYLSVIPGEMSLEAPTEEGQYVIPLGIAMNSTTFLINIQTAVEL